MIGLGPFRRIAGCNFAQYGEAYVARPSYKGVDFWIVGEETLEACYLDGSIWNFCPVTGGLIHQTFRFQDIYDVPVQLPEGYPEDCKKVPDGYNAPDTHNKPTPIILRNNDNYHVDSVYDDQGLLVDGGYTYVPNGLVKVHIIKYRCIAAVGYDNKGVLVCNISDSVLLNNGLGYNYVDITAYITDKKVPVYHTRTTFNLSPIINTYPDIVFTNGTVNRLSQWPEYRIDEEIIL